jgi:hypothetical protein
MIHALGLINIGGSAYFVWAYPPNFGCTPQKHVRVHRHMTVASPNGWRDDRNRRAVSHAPYHARGVMRPRMRHSGSATGCGANALAANGLWCACGDRQSWCGCASPVMLISFLAAVGDM